MKQLKRWLYALTTCIVFGSLLMTGCGTPPTSTQQQAFFDLPCLPKPEVCDGKDNDCNGVIDDVLLAPTQCQTTCGQGVIVCQGGELRCKSPNSQPEKCNGKDDDCDGLIDNGLNCECLDGQKKVCGSGIGQCKTGFQACKNGQWGTCTGTPPSTEICDSKDNDCDGLIDEALSTVCRLSPGVYGYRICSNGQWSTCTNRYNPGR